MPESYSWEIRETAEELYIIDGLTYEQVADKTGVSISQLKRWAMDSVPVWTERRREYRQAQTTIRRNVMRTKAAMSEKLAEVMDPQLAYAFRAMVGAGRDLDQDARERLEGSTADGNGASGEKKDGKMTKAEMLAIINAVYGG